MENSLLMFFTHTQKLCQSTHTHTHRLGSQTTCVTSTLTGSGTLRKAQLRRDSALVAKVREEGVCDCFLQPGSCVMMASPTNGRAA